MTNHEPYPPPALPAHSCDEPFVAVPAGLLGQAIELLELCDQLLNHPGHHLIDARAQAVINRYGTPPSATAVRWFHDSLAATAGDLQDHLDAQGIVVDPTLRNRPARHH
jgi:hypothetical protein